MMSKARELIEALKEKPLPRELSKESRFIGDEIKKKGYAEVGVDLGGDASDLYAVVPIKSAKKLESGEFDLSSADSGEDKVYLDSKKGYAWMYLGVVD